MGTGPIEKSGYGRQELARRGLHGGFTGSQVDWEAAHIDAVLDKPADGHLVEHVLQRLQARRGATREGVGLGAVWSSQ